jgi:tRNA threonylcarbamoyl adenosine modification protein YjeE
VTLPDSAATAALGRRIAHELKKGDCIAMEGDLGAGKTTLARAILEELGVRETVPSPTFALVQSYETKRLPVHHYDFYRIENEREIEELGFEEALSLGAVLVEWPERAAQVLPAATLRVRLEPVGETMRRATASGPDRWTKFLEGLGANAG